MPQSITIAATINAPLATVWKCYTTPEDIVQWNAASPDWHTTHAENDLRPGGRFLSRMEAKDGSFGFDFGGEYDAVETEKLIAYTMGDGRTVRVTFAPAADGVVVTVVFDAENENPLDMQRAGWQSILNNFKAYVEAKTA
jgi:uncharacterized protein YndB with AHSA1/START domain